MPSRRRPRATASATPRSSSASSTRTHLRVASALSAGDRRPPRLAAMTESAVHDDPRDVLEGALFEIKQVIIGQDAMLERVLVALLCGGHVLLEGVPGLAKTLTIKTLA